jgi:nitroreductase
MLIDLVLKNRSYRRFDCNAAISAPILFELIELARVSPSSRNQQALKFLPVNDPRFCELLFPCLAWAGYLKDWDGPVQEERPTGYIIISGDTNLGTKFDIDLGICAQTILLGANEKNFGGCMIASIRREEVRKLFGIPEHLEILLVIALGKPVERVVIDPLEDGDIRYWRDAERTHHVPKRFLSDIILDGGML